VQCLIVNSKCILCVSCVSMLICPHDIPSSFIVERNVARD